jgi:HPt (histidine-containing phosphotransfer) domain-containing protein
MMSDRVIDDAAFGQTLDMVGGDLGFLGQLVEEYRGDGASRVADMRAALAAGAAEDVRRAAHTLKGSSASLGANGLAEACREVETAARNGRLDGLGPKVDAIAAEFEAVVLALATRVGSAG